jgi:hypothetical protein
MIRIRRRTIILRKQTRRGAGQILKITINSQATGH